jgi:hypothetical protein
MAVVELRVPFSLLCCSWSWSMSQSRLKSAEMVGIQVGLVGIFVLLEFEVIHQFSDGTALLSSQTGLWREWHSRRMTTSRRSSCASV